MSSSTIPPRRINQTLDGQLPSAGGAAASIDRPEDEVQRDTLEARPSIGAASRTHVVRHRALVLHGGGSAGNAWEIGIVAGLSDAGVALIEADLIVGTSAGATVAAQMTAASPVDLLTAILDAAVESRDRVGRGADGRGLNVPVVNHMEVSNDVIHSSRDADDMRRRMGAAALAHHAPFSAERQDHWRDIVAARLPHHRWPYQLILITAVDAHTGEPVVFDRDSGVDLVDAVAASCANGFGVAPYVIGERRFIDGGYRRNENADLAAGYARVLVLSPFGGRTRHPLSWGMQLSAQVEELRAGGSRVETVFPDAASLAAFGPNMMDLSRRPPSARAGYQQGRSLAERLLEFWR